MTAPTLNPCLRDFWTTPARNRVLHGGRASSKSWDAAGFSVFLANKYRIKVLCARQFQNRIAESVYSLLKIQIERFGLGKNFDILNNKITSKTTGSEFMFYGLWRSIDEIKSLEDIDILWIEEAHNLTEKQWEILEPTIRKAHSQIWVIFNPRLATDFAYKRFVVNPPPNTVVREINYDENPFLSDTMLQIINAAREEDYEKYLHIYRGVPRQDDDSVIIKRSWIMAAIDAHKVLKWDVSGRKRIGFDIADSGQDKCAYVYAHGSVVLDADLWKAGEDELLKSCTKVFYEARAKNADVTYDSIGVGAGCGAKINELNKAMDCRVLHTKFNAGGSVFQPEKEYSAGTKNRDHFLNIKAQAWWLVADRLRNTFNAVHNGQQFKVEEMISISSDTPYLSQIIDELSTPKRDFNENGKVMVESKKKLKDRDVDSPNLGDGFIMAFAPGITPMQISQAALDNI